MHPIQVNSHITAGYHYEPWRDYPEVPSVGADLGLQSGRWSLGAWIRREFPLGYGEPVPQMWRGATWIAFRWLQTHE
jgi:hypothetical protein